MMKFQAICLAGMLFAGIGCKDNHQLAYDFTWMNNTYNPHKEVSGAIGHGETGWYSFSKETNTDVLQFGSNETFSSDGCKLTIKDEPNKAARLLREIHNESIDRVDLRDIDPNSLKVKTYSHYGGFECAQYSNAEREKENMVCDHAKLVAKTRNEEPLVSIESKKVYEKLNGKDHEAFGKDKASSIQFEFDDIEYANKFANVFRDAVKLCGGTTGAGN